MQSDAYRVNWGTWMHMVIICTNQFNEGRIHMAAMGL
jgi:hypothetical protein